MISQQTLPLPEAFLGHTIERAEHGVIIDGHLVERVTIGDAFVYWWCRDRSLSNEEAKTLAEVAYLWRLTKLLEAGLL